MSNETMKDPLLAELAGQGEQPAEPLNNVTIKTEGQDPALHPAKLAADAAAEDPLAVKPKPTPSAIAAKDAVHATQFGGKGYRVTVEGNYFAPAKDAPGKKVLKPYKLEVNLPQLDGALSIIKNKLLPILLPKKHPESMGFQTHAITGYVALGGAPESNHLTLMKRPQLEQFVEQNGVPLKPEEYADTEVLREAIIDWTLNPKDFEKREAARQADRAETKKLLDMNPELVAPAGV